VVTNDKKQKKLVTKITDQPIKVPDNSNRLGWLLLQRWARESEFHFLFFRLPNKWGEKGATTFELNAVAREVVMEALLSASRKV
jgi:hypothetical protein